MHIHIPGACDTFMGGVALLAKQAGHRVSGQDQHTYPPMSTQLESEGIELYEGYSPDCMDPAPDLVVIGNALSRGNPAVEYVLDNYLEYVSGPRVVNESSKTAMKEVLDDIQSGKFVKDWMLENRINQPSFKAMRAKCDNHDMEVVGKKLRDMMPWIAERKMVDKAKN